MTGHDIMVATTALTFIGAALVCLAIVRQLGPSDYTGGRSAPWLTRLCFGLAFLGLMWRGLSLMFPGAALDVANMSPNVLTTALICLGGATFILDVVLRDRNPPPLVQRFLRVVERRGLSDGETIDLAMVAPVAGYELPGRINRCIRRTRLVVVAAAVTVLAGLAGVLVVAVAT